MIYLTVTGALVVLLAQLQGISAGRTVLSLESPGFNNKSPGFNNSSVETSVTNSYDDSSMASSISFVNKTEQNTVSPPPIDGISNSSIWDSGKFVLMRREVVVPSGQAQGYWYCAGWQDVLYSRLMVFAPNVTFDEIAIESSTWQDPPNDWNSTINAEAIQRVNLVTGSMFGGSMCSCIWFQLNFGEWLQSNSEVGSTTATDMYHQPNQRPVSNWYFPPKYLPSDYDFRGRIEEVYTGAPLATVSSGWHDPKMLEGTSPITTTNKYLRLENTGGPVSLRAMSNSPRAYGIVIYLIKEDPDPSDQQDNGPINPMELYTTETSDITKATHMTFASVPKGYYYSVFIRNSFEETTAFTSTPPYECTMGPYGLETQYDVTYSLQSCEEAACNADTIVVVDDPGLPSSARTIFDGMNMVYSLFSFAMVSLMVGYAP